MWGALRVPCPLQAASFGKDKSNGARKNVFMVFNISKLLFIENLEFLGLRCRFRMLSGIKRCKVNLEHKMKIKSDETTSV